MLDAEPSATQQPREAVADARVLTERQVIRVATVLVVTLDAALDLEPELLVELQCVVVGRPGVTGDGPVVLGDPGDEAFAEALVTVRLVDGQKQNVAVAPDGREPYEVIISAPIDVEVDRRTTVRVLKETPPLSEDPVLTANPLFELPGLVDEVCLARIHGPPLDVDAHCRTILAGAIIIPPAGAGHNAFTDR